MNDQQSKQGSKKTEESSQNKKASKSKKSTKGKLDEAGNVAGYLKDISKINQDIENIKSRGTNEKKKSGSDKDSINDEVQESENKSKKKDAEMTLK